MAAFLHYPPNLSFSLSGSKSLLIIQKPTCFYTGQHADSQERAVGGTVILYEMLGTRVLIFVLILSVFK